MLIPRSDRTQSGQKLTVSVTYPRRYVLARLVRGLTIKGAVLGALLGFGHAATVHSSGHAQPGDAAMTNLAIETLAGAAMGATAGLTGALAYAFIGGAPGAAAGILGAGLVAGGSYAALPSLAALPQTAESVGTSVKTETSRKLGYIEPGKTDNPYTPVLSDDTIKEEAPPAAPIYSGPYNDRIVFLGMNAEPTARAVRLMRRRTEVTVISNSGPQDRVRVNGKIYDLRDKAGIAAFASSLKLPAKNTAGVRHALQICEKDAKDELADLAAIWAQGEKGAKIPSRLVLAGHSNGDGVWGDGNGSLRLGPLLELSRALPHATAQIEDAFVTGCYSGGEVTMDQYLLIFPRARTIWAYEAQAPGVDNGATIDQAGWQEATRGRKFQTLDGPSASPGKRLSVWNYKTGYHASKPPLDLAALRGKVDWMEENFYRPAFSGQQYTYADGFKIPISITDPYTGPVRQYYSWLVRLTQEKNLPEDERAYWVEKKHQAIRLLYFSKTVAPAFEQHFRAELTRGYAKMGLKAPNFGHLSRAAALREIAAFQAQLRRHPNAPGDAEQLGVLLEQGLGELDPRIVPDGWV